MIIFMPLRAFVQQEGRESISNRHFLVVVPQPISFPSLNKQTSHSS